MVFVKMAVKAVRTALCSHETGGVGINHETKECQGGSVPGARLVSVILAVTLGGGVGRT